MKIPYNDLKKRIIKKNEDEPRRHKKRCIYYGEDSCNYYMVKCPGSSSCTKYKENNFVDYNQNKEKYKKPNTDHKSYKMIYLKKHRNCTIIIHIDEFRMNQIESMIKKYSKYHLCINLRNAQEFSSTMEKLKITQIYIEFEGKLKPCFFIRNNVKTTIKKDLIKIEIDIERFLNAIPISKKCKQIWKEKDPLNGEIEILLNPVNKDKKKRNKK